MAQVQTALLSRSDASFVKDAAEGSLDEIKLGELAQQNAASERVKFFGKRMIKDHMKLNNELQALASQKSLALPEDIGIMHKASKMYLGTKTGSS